MRIVNPDLVKTKPKPTREVLAPDVVKKKQKAKKVFVVPREEVKVRKQGIHEDSIPPGTLCYLRKKARQWFGFDYCTVLGTTVGSSGKYAYADVITPEGKTKQIDLMWLRNVDVQNGNLEEDEEE